MKSFCIKVGGILIIFGVAFFLLMLPDLKTLLTEPVDICAEELTDVSQLQKGLSVETDMPYLLERFVTVETRHQDQGGKTTKVEHNGYYTLPVYIDDEIYYIAYESDPENPVGRLVDYYARPTKLEPNAEMGKPIYVRGGLHKLGDEEYEYMLKWFDEKDWFFNVSPEKYVLPVVLKPIDEANVYFITKLCGGAVALGLVLVLVGNLGRKKKKEEEA